jgi:hypothetical protein
VAAQRAEIGTVEQTADDGFAASKLNRRFDFDLRLPTANRPKHKAHIRIYVTTGRDLYVVE